jgi:hypothetical protein
MPALVIEVRACRQAGKSFLAIFFAKKIGNACLPASRKRTAHFCVVALSTVWAWATVQKWGTPK